MNTKTKTKKFILIGCIAAAVALAITLTVVLWPKKAPDPRALLADADRLSEQNLCLMALLQSNPDDEESLRQLLLNYQILGADPLTIEATRQAAGADITLPQEVTLQKEEPGEICGFGGIVQNGIRSTDFSSTGAVATDGETVYLAKESGIWASYHGLEVKISPARAERMIPCENGLYFLNTTAKRVQYIARDGHRTETLSAVPAADFAFLNGTLWVAGADGGLYKGSEHLESDLAFEELCAADGRLYAATAEGLAAITESGAALLLPSPASAITAGNAVVYYIDENSYPARFDPAKNEAVILKEKTATALGFDKGKLHYLNQKGRIRKLNKK